MIPRLSSRHSHDRIFNGVGKFSKWPFGILDFGDEKPNIPGIELLEENQKNIIDEVNSHI